ncbi:MAG: hypothetical protein GEU68_13340 [Actinobacteria bacterium]|nr:hypothetical protein [Actinomycetota bacterium]
MFIEDLRLFLIPYELPNGDERNQPRVEVETDEDRAALAVLLNVHDHRDLDDGVTDFMRNLIWSLGYEGRAVHEISLSQSDDSEERRFHRLFLLPSGPLLRVGGRYLQWVPSHARESRGMWMSIDGDRIWDLRIPRSLGRPVRQKRTIRRLARLSLPAPEFAVRDLQKASRAGYDFQVYWRESEIATARATRTWGWSGRWAWRDFSTEYFQFYREVKFRRSLAVLRNHLVSEMNDLFLRLGIRARMHLERKTPVADFDAGLERLASGDWDFARLREEGLTS